MKITVVGAGYVGLANALLLAQQHRVVVLEVAENKVACINTKKSPLPDEDMAHFFSSQTLSLSATCCKEAAFKGAEFILMALPSPLDPETHRLDTRLLETVIGEAIALNPQAVIVVKSTVPIGFTVAMRDRFGVGEALLVSPEFLREKHALEDVLHPMRIVVGGHAESAQTFARLLTEGAKKENISILLTDPSEAEAIKLFSNAYLAMRVAYFNELDSYALTQGLDARVIIEGLGLDPRIGKDYHNPSFGYDGACLPKDTQQLLTHYREDGVRQHLVSAIIASNATRKAAIVDSIVKKRPKVVGGYGRAASSYRPDAAALDDILDQLSSRGIKTLRYDAAVPAISLDDFKRQSDVILANRRVSCLLDVSDKVFSRDLYPSPSEC